jgi:hypothetical protein
MQFSETKVTSTFEAPKPKDEPLARNEGKPERKQCPDCRHFSSGDGGTCELTDASICEERGDYSNQESCGDEARWFMPHLPLPEPRPVEAGSRFPSLRFLAGILVGALGSLVWTLLLTQGR